MLVLKKVTVDYGESTPLRSLSHTFQPGAAAIMGPSGSGKSTLLRIIAGLQKPTSGTVSLCHTSLQQPSWHSAGDPRVCLVHQDYRLVPFLTVADNLRLAAEMRELDVDDQLIREAMDRVGLSKIDLRRMPGTLSGGEQQRAAIARGLVSRVKVLLADEPTGALDVANSHLVAEVLMDISAYEDMCVVVATHDPAVAQTIGDVYVLRNGQLTQDDHQGVA